MTTAHANRYVPPDPDYRLPVEPPDGIGIVYESCQSRRHPIELPVSVTRLMRQGDELRLCFRCGPEGSVYHPSTLANIEAAHPGITTEYPGEYADHHDYTMAEIMELGIRLIAESRYWEDAITPDAMAAFDRKMRHALD